MTLWHRLMHLCGWTTGSVYTWWDDTGTRRRLLVGFKCDVCSCIEGIHESVTEPRHDR